MRGTRRLLVGAGCILLLALSWLTAVTAKSDTQRQEELLAQASAYLQDGIYIRAVPLLEEAAGCRGKHTWEAEDILKTVYLQLADKDNYRRRYTGLLDTQMARADAPESVFQEAAEYYLELGSYKEAFRALREGISKTESPKLKEIYEGCRYVYQTKRGRYEAVTEIYNGAVQVQQDGKWGLADKSGSLVIPCEYDWLSTYSNGTALARREGEITAVDADNNRTALLHQEAFELGNFSEDRAPLRMADGWHWCNGELAVGEKVFEALGMYSEGYAAAKQGGRWGVIDKSSEWVLPAEYDAILQDGLGRCCAQNAVFARKDGAVQLLVDSKPVGGIYEDAKPFADGYAAVRKNGKWGFIDTEGNVKIDFRFEDALSFGQHVAAVQVDGLWGYINLQGEIVIEPCFEQAKSFSGGCAPVKDYDGWMFIELVEYQEDAGL